MNEISYLISVLIACNLSDVHLSKGGVVFAQTLVSLSFTQHTIVLGPIIMPRVLKYTPLNASLPSQTQILRVTL